VQYVIVGLSKSRQEVGGIRDLVTQWLKMVEFFEKALKLKRLN